MKFLLILGFVATSLAAQANDQIPSGFFGKWSSGCVEEEGLSEYYENGVLVRTEAYQYSRINEVEVRANGEFLTQDSTFEDTTCTVATDLGDWEKFDDIQNITSDGTNNVTISFTGPGKVEGDGVHNGVLRAELVGSTINIYFVSGDIYEEGQKVHSITEEMLFAKYQKQ